MTQLLRNQTVTYTQRFNKMSLDLIDV